MAGIIRKKALKAGEGGSAPSVRRQSSGIKRRWIVNNMSIVALLLVTYIPFFSTVFLKGT